MHSVCVYAVRWYSKADVKEKTPRRELFPPHATLLPRGQARLGAETGCAPHFPAWDEAVCSDFAP